MLTVGQIETLVQHFAADTQIVLTSGKYKTLAQMVYEGLATPDYRLLNIKIGRRWPEANRIDTGKTTTASVGTYTFTFSLGTFREEPVVKILDVSDSNRPYRVWPVPDEETWDQMFTTSASTPLFYRKYRNAANDDTLIVFRPAPNTTGDIIEINGELEITTLSVSTETTIFTHRQTDKALSMLIAAQILVDRNQEQKALTLITQAAGLLPAQDWTPRKTRSTYERQGF